MNHQELAEAIYKASNLKGEFRLRSGKISNEYFDKYLFESQPSILKPIADEMSKMVCVYSRYLAWVNYMLQLPTCYIDPESGAAFSCRPSALT